MDFSSDSTWGWIQRVALILGALASLIVIVDFDPGPGAQSAPPIVVERPSPPVPLPPAAEPEAAPAEREPVTTTVHKTPSGERYHRESCYHVRGKATAIELSLEAAKAMGLTPCRICNPDR